LLARIGRTLVDVFADSIVGVGHVLVAVFARALVRSSGISADGFEAAFVSAKSALVDVGASRVVADTRPAGGAVALVRAFCIAANFSEVVAIVGAVSALVDIFAADINCVTVAIRTGALAVEITVRNARCVVCEGFSDMSGSAETSSLALALSAEGEVEVGIANVIEVVQSRVTCSEALVVDAFVKLLVFAASDREVARIFLDTASAHANGAVALVGTVVIQAIRPVVDLAGCVLRSRTLVDVLANIAVGCVSFITLAVV